MPFITLLLPLLGEAGEAVAAILSAVAAVKTLIWIGHMIHRAIQGRTA